MADQRKAALDNALRKIEKNFGKGSIMRMGDAADTKIATISSGSLAIDEALGVGGYPRGRIIEMYGPESSGKTTVALHAVAEVQRRGGTAAYIDAENALDPQYATALGVQINDLLLSQPDTGEQGLEIADALIASGAVDIVVVDSVAALVPRGRNRRGNGGHPRGVTGPLDVPSPAEAFRGNQQDQDDRHLHQPNPGKGGGDVWEPETTPGGRALKFYSTIRMEIRRGEQLKNGTDVIGNRAKIKVVKNKVAPPFRKAEVDIMYGEGISKTGELLDMAVEKDLVNKSGAWYSYGNERIGQGRENAKQWFADHEDAMNELMNKVRVAYGMEPDEAPATKEGEPQQETIEEASSDK